MVNKWYLIGKLTASEYRIKILEDLEHDEGTSTDIEKAVKIKISHVSRALKELTEMGLVKCLNPELRKNKIYAITTKGKEILKELRKP